MGEFTVRDVLEVTMRQLNRVMVPVEMINQVGIPIRDAVHNMQMCVEAIDREAAKQAEEQDMIELFADGESLGKVPAEPAEEEQEQ